MQTLKRVERHYSLDFLKDLKLRRVGEVACLSLEDALDSVLLLFVDVRSDVRVFFKLVKEITQDRLRAKLEVPCGLPLFEYNLYDLLEERLLVLSAALRGLVLA